MITLGQYTHFTKGEGCVGKKVFPSYARAEEELGRLIRKGYARLEQGTLAPYYCGFCFGYHLGHASGRAK